MGQQAASSNLSYEVINLGTPLGGSLAAVQTISLQGFLAGYANLPNNAQHAVLFEFSGTKDLGTLGGQNSAILGGLSGFSETATSDPLGQDFCETGTHLVCLAFTLGNRNQVVAAAHAGGHVRGSLWHERSWSGGGNLVDQCSRSKLPGGW